MVHKNNATVRFDGRTIHYWQQHNEPNIFGIEVGLPKTDQIMEIVLVKMWLLSTVDM